MAQTLFSPLFRCLGASIAIACLQVTSIAQDAATLHWFRFEAQADAANAWYRWAVDPAVAISESAELTIVTDGHCSLYVNGQRILKNVSLQKSGGSVAALGFDVRPLLRQGRNTVAVEIHSSEKTTLLGIAISAVQGDQKSAVGGLWRMASIVPPVGWQQTDFNDRGGFAATRFADFTGDEVTVAAGRSCQVT